MIFVKFPSLSIGQDWKGLQQFESLNENEKPIVFYAENKASMNHFRTLIYELTENMNFKICLVTSVKDDPILKSKNDKIKSFYIGDGTARTKFFLTLKTKIMIMDMPDLESFHIKRSKIYPVHYIYLFHSMFSIHSYLRKGAIDNYDTIFCVGSHHIDEISKTEKIYNLKSKKIIKYGFGRLDWLLKEKEKIQNTLSIDANTIIIAPSYGKNNLLEVCGIELIKILLKSNFKVILRPHFKTLKDSKELIDLIKKNFEKNDNFTLETGIIPFNTFYQSQCLISDWSGIAMEYPFVFERPVIFIDVPKKILNSNADDIGIKPIEIEIRKEIGHIISPEKIEQIPELIIKIKKDNLRFGKEIKILRSNIVYNIENSAKIGGMYIKELLDQSKN
jgi:hypothetical protein